MILKRSKGLIIEECVYYSQSHSDGIYVLLHNIMHREEETTQVTMKEKEYFSQQIFYCVRVSIES